MAVVQGKIDDLTESLVGTLRSELNKRGIGGETFLANEVLEEVKGLHKEMGVMMKGDGRKQLLTGYARGGGGSNYQETLVPNEEVPMLIPTDGGRSHRQMYCWGGQLHNVPENFEIPRMTLQTLITYWYCGSKVPLVPPLKYAKLFDFPTKKSMKVTLSQMKRTMREVHRAGDRMGFNFRDTGWTTGKATRLYEMVHPCFAYPSLKHTRRFVSINWKTYHNLVVKNKGRLADEIAQ